MQMIDKKSQRSYYRNLRKSLDKSLKTDLDKDISNIFIDFAKNHKDMCFLVYVSNEFEIDTKDMIKFLFDNNFDVFAPRCETGTNVMNFYRIKSFSDLESGYFGIFEPKKYCEKICDLKNAICIVPGICFDKKGYRIGYGKGFYDRFFSENSCFLKIGICYEAFVIDEIYRDDNDVPVDYILTERGLHERSLL